MLINQIIDVKEVFVPSTVTEPVSLKEAKDYLRLASFVSDDSGGTSDDFDDTLINSMISEGREWLEKYTGQYIVPRSLTVVLLNQAGGQQLPGPVTGSVVYKSKTVDITTKLTTVGSSYPKIMTAWAGGGGYDVRVVPYTSFTLEDDHITAEYSVGYTTFPAWVKNAIRAYVADHFEFRGDDEAPAPNERATQIARPHRRSSAWG